MESIHSAMKKLIVPLAVIMFAATPHPAAQETAGQGPSLDISVDEAVTMALENNRSLEIQKLSPLVSEERVKSQEAAFDPDISAGLSNTASKSNSGTKSRRTRETLYLSRRLYSGTEISIGASVDNNSSGSDNDLYSTGLSVSLTKPLTRGAGTDVNTTGIVQARISREISHLRLRAYTESLVEEVIDTYWNFVLAKRKIEIYEESLDLARKQFEESEALVEVGKLAEVELVAARAEVASREQSLIDVRGQVESLRLRLLRLLNPAQGEYMWELSLNPTEKLTVPEVDLGELSDHIETATRERADLCEARLSLESGDLDVVKTRNGLLPYLGFYINLGKSGYAETFRRSVDQVFSDNYNLQVGINASYTLGNRTADASYRQSLYNMEEAEISIENLEVMAVEEVRAAWIEVERARNKIEASGASAMYQEEKVRAESEKYRVGKSTSLDVVSVQRDLLQGRLNLATAKADYLKSIVALYGTEGVLIERLGIEVTP